MPSWTSLAAAGTSTGPLDVRENVRFRGRQLAAWTHARYPDRGIVLALEFKKTFMDEWTGEVDRARIDELARALAGTVPRRGIPARGGGAVTASGPGATRADAVGPETSAIDAGGFSPADLAADHAMASLAGSVRFLLEMTPVNADDVRAAFLAHPESDPVFEYRELDVDPDVLDAQVAALPLDDVADTTLAALLRNRQREMTLRVEMLRARNTPDFLQLSIAQYGAAAACPGASRRGPAGSAAERAAGARLRGRGGVPGRGAGGDRPLPVDRPGRRDPCRDPRRRLRACSWTATRCSSRATPRWPAPRVNALLQHEVGTHLVTQVNGLAQPIRMMGSGLAHYDETQEGLAVLAEIACGGLTASRLRQLAARVVAVHSLVGGASFVETHRLLTGHGLPAGSAYSVAMRVYRAGGFTKDAIYLRGVLALLEHVAAGGVLDLFFLGKFSMEDLPLVEDLAATRAPRPGTGHAPVPLRARGRRQAAGCRPRGRPGDAGQRVGSSSTTASPLSASLDRPLTHRRRRGDP